MKKKLLIALIIILIIIITLICIVINNKNKQKINISDKEIYENNVKGIELLIEGMSSETKNEINDIKELEQKLKEYAYENNLVNYGKSEFELIKEGKKKNILTLILEAKDMYKTKIIVDINLDENTYEFYNYK